MKEFSTVSRIEEITSTPVEYESKRSERIEKLLAIVLTVTTNFNEVTNLVTNATCNESIMTETSLNKNEVPAREELFINSDEAETFDDTQISSDIRNELLHKENNDLRVKCEKQGTLIRTKEFQLVQLQEKLKNKCNEVDELNKENIKIKSLGSTTVEAGR